VRIAQRIEHLTRVLSLIVAPTVAGVPTRVPVNVAL
jgi:hypothetical protein